MGNKSDFSVAGMKRKSNGKWERDRKGNSKGNQQGNGKWEMGNGQVAGQVAGSR